ncbi:MAG: PEP-CTERM sorting domain-containing protein [Myxococcota bacterium]
MVVNISLRMRRAALAAFVGGIASLLAPVGSAMQVAPIQPVVWDTADGGTGHTYLFVPLPYTTSWSAANAEAETITLPDGTKGYLTTIESDEERTFIREQVLPDDWANPISAVWVAPENQYMLVNDNHPSSNGQLPLGKNLPSAVAPEHWKWGKWQSENEPDHHGLIEKRFLSKWDKNGNGHSEQDGCDNGPPQFPLPKILGMIVEFDTIDVPEPATALLSAFGMALLGLVRRCR